MTSSACASKLHENSLSRRDFSGELEVFDAAQYFYGDAAQDERPVSAPRPSAGNSPFRSSLDSYAIGYPAKPWVLDQKPQKESTKPRTPSSPGAKLASLLNSIFVQTPAKKKKQKPGENLTDELSGGRRQRRSSISVINFGFTSRKNTGFSTSDSPGQQCQSSTSEINFAPTKSRRELSEKYRTSKVAEKPRPDFPWMDEAFSFRYQIPEKTQDCHQNPRKTEESYDDAASDSSSDLFDLPNQDFWAGGVPVPLYKASQMVKLNVPRRNFQGSNCIDFK